MNRHDNFRFAAHGLGQRNRAGKIVNHQIEKAPGHPPFHIQVGPCAARQDCTENDENRRRGRGEPDAGPKNDHTYDIHADRRGGPKAKRVDWRQATWTRPPSSQVLAPPATGRATRR